MTSLLDLNFGIGRFKKPVRVGRPKKYRQQAILTDSDRRERLSLYVETCQQSDRQRLLSYNLQGPNKGEKV